MIQVTGCRVLIKPFKIQEHDKVFASARAAGIAIPEFSERKEQAQVEKGTVVQVGENSHSDYIGSVKVGDVIGFAKYGGKFVTDKDDELYVIINDEDVICIYKD